MILVETINVVDANANIIVGLSVRGPGIPEGAYVADIGGSTVFELSVATFGGIHTNSTLTFGGDVHIFSKQISSSTKNKWST